MKKIYQIIADASLSGAPRHVLTILKHLNPDDFNLTLVCPKGWLFAEAQEIGIKTIKINTLSTELLLNLLNDNGYFLFIVLY